MSKPIVFVKSDHRPGKESLILIYRPDSATTKGEKQLTVCASSLAQESLEGMESFIATARPILREKARLIREGPLEMLHVDVGPDGITIEEW